MGGQPVPEGVRLYKALVSTGQVVLLSDDLPTLDEWLELNGLTGHAFVCHGMPTDLDLDRANLLRRQGYDIDLVVTPDPSEAIGLIYAGFNTLLFTHSQYTQPGWRPDAGRGIRAWQDVVDETARLARLKANDARLRDE